MTPRSIRSRRPATGTTRPTGTRHGGRRRVRSAGAIGACLALSLAAASCGDDDEDAADVANDAITDVSDAATEASDAIDDGLTDASDAVDDAITDADDAVDDAVDDATDDTDSGDGASDTTMAPGGPPPVNPCAAGESGTIGEAPEPADGATPIEVTAREYSFDGLEQIDGTGSYALILRNEGAQLHELILVRIDDDETRPIEELLEEDDPSQFATDIAFAFACPGDAGEPTAVEIDEPGRYAAVCFIPVGVTPETPAEEFETLGPPHAMEGMVAEFEVT